MTTSLAGRLVLDEEVVAGRLILDGATIAAVEPDPSAEDAMAGPFIAPGFVDLHVHGYGGHDAMGGADALDGMARALLRRGVTSFLPTAVTAALDTLDRFVADVRGWTPSAPDDGADPLGFNLEGPFISPRRPGAQNQAHIASPVDVPRSRIEGWLDGWRITTVAPEIEGGLELIAWLREHGVVPSLGHSAATAEEARAGYAAGAGTTTHLFNAMTGVDHRTPGLGGRRAPHGRRGRGAHRRWAARPSRRLAAHPAGEARGPDGPRERRVVDLRDGRHARRGRWCPDRDPVGPLHRRRDHDARGLGHRAGQRRPQPGRAGRVAAAGRRRGLARPAGGGRRHGPRATGAGSAGGSRGARRGAAGGGGHEGGRPPDDLILPRPGGLSRPGR